MTNLLLRMHEAWQTLRARLEAGDPEAREFAARLERMTNASWYRSATTVGAERRTHRL